MNKLYILGNGFDLYHGLDTKYQSFGLFLQENHEDLYDYLLEYYGLPHLDIEIEESKYDPFWADFENALAEIDFDNVLDSKSDYLANVSDPNFKDREWHAFQVEIKSIVDDLTDKLFEAFREFILQVEFPTSIDDKYLNLEKDAIYVSFNYTDTLERYYGIPRENIFYIHKKAKEGETLILGHGINPEEFKVESPKPPEGLSEEEYYEWQERMSDEYDYSYESGKAELMNYFTLSFKETSKVIEDNADFFDKIKHIQEVKILGHSLSDIDIPYLIKILKSIGNTNAIWSVSYYHEEEKETRKKRLSKLGIPDNQIELIKIENLKHAST